ncbi:histone deacetylase family protein [Necator americanus]|uniref:Histone deacetylase family protein n=1 Tax=Necator americanus TaxID=51031 RepID=W2T4C6_NECAM|nr:histone deacetylase family protein [Necator americanus]ETN75802.1 histone deacetylase family protein [Necator americanus]
MQKLKSRPATEKELEMVHTAQYISEIKRTKEMNEEDLERFSSNYEDIYVNRQTFDAALMAAGCVFNLVDAVSKTGTPGFAAVRPPGHHAFPDRGCGFCIFNNVALAAKHALKNGISRVLIVDWDVHAGQGTQECINGDDRILLISIHRFQHGHFWPNLQQSGVKTKFKNTVNIPLNDIGMCDSDYLAVFQLVVHPIINDFKPHLILVSCGFDAALGDPEGEMKLTPAGYATLTHQLMTWRIPLAMVLEGGYFMDSVAADFEWVVRALTGEEIPRVQFEKINAALPLVINNIHKEYGSTYPTLTMIRELKHHLEPDVEKDSGTAEYEGTKDFSIPFPTRGVYRKREEHIILWFREKLREITSTYQELKSYKDVHYTLIEDRPFSYIKSGSSIMLQVSSKAKGAAHLLIAQSVNPLLRSNALESHISHFAIERIAELLQKIRNNCEKPLPYILYL